MTSRKHMASGRLWGKGEGEVNTRQNANHASGIAVYMKLGDYCGLLQLIKVYCSC